MDISGWPMDRIMQLPDDAFGTRHAVTIDGRQVGAVDTFSISPLGFPDRIVIWEILLNVMGSTGILTSLGIRLGDKLPTSVTEFLTLEPLFSNNFGFLAESSIFLGIGDQVLALTRLKVPVETTSRHLVLSHPSSGPGTVSYQFSLVFSSIPREIPDFYKGSPTEQLDEMVRLLRIGVKMDKEKW